MGIIKVVSAKDLKPTQTSLRWSSLRDILNFYDTGDEDSLLPVPVKDDGDFLILDGHNRVSVAFLLHRDLRVYVPNNCNDFLSLNNVGYESSLCLRQNNYNISSRFDTLDMARKEVVERYGIVGIFDLLRKKGIRSIEDLRYEIKTLPDFAFMS